MSIVKPDPVGIFQIVQIVGCMKNMGNLIDKIDIGIDLHHGGALVVDKELAKAICRILGTKPQVRA